MKQINIWVTILGIFLVTQTMASNNNSEFPNSDEIWLMGVDGSIAHKSATTQSKEGLDNFIEELRQSGNCTHILDVLLSSESEGTRLAQAATKRLEITNGIEDKIGLKYAEIAGRHLARRDAARVLLINMCFKK